MGQTKTGSAVSFVNIDTNDCKYALNAGLRQVSVDIPFRVRDTVTIVAGTQEYVLSTRFMEVSDFGYPFDAWRITSDGKRLYGMQMKTPKEFALPSDATDAFEFSVQDSTILINPAFGEGSNVYIEGRGQLAGAVTHNTYVLASTGMPRTDRQAAVYWAVYVLSMSRGAADLATVYRNMYDDFVFKRTGRPAQGVTQ